MREIHSKPVVKVSQSVSYPPYQVKVLIKEVHGPSVIAANQVMAIGTVGGVAG